MGQFNTYNNYKLIAALEGTVAKSITAATAANPSVMSSVAHGLTTGDLISINFPDINPRSGYTRIAGKVNVVGVDSFSVDGVDFTTAGVFNLPITGTFYKAASITSITGLVDDIKITNPKPKVINYTNTGSSTEGAIHGILSALTLEFNLKTGTDDTPCIKFLRDAQIQNKEIILAVQNVNTGITSYAIGVSHIDDVTATAMANLSALMVSFAANSTKTINQHTI